MIVKQSIIYRLRVNGVDILLGKRLKEGQARLKYGEENQIIAARGE